MTQHKKTWPIDMMCRVLGVNRNSYYSYQRRQANKVDDPLHEEMVECVEKIVKGSDYTYGRRRVKEAMGALSYPMSCDKASQLMKEAEVEVRHKRKFKVTTNSHHQLPLFENLLKREFKVDQPDTVYVSDVTYIWTQEGWLYLAVVIDLFSRKVVGWSMSSRMKASLVCDALKMAIWQRQPHPGLIHHSDRGSQYASNAFRKLLKLYKFKGSMSKQGDCWDNAVVESFFGTLKQERVHWRHYQTRYAAQQDILQYITMFYNCIRMHSYLGYKSPSQFEKESLEMKKAA